MPDSQGKLSEEEKVIARNWLNTNWKNWACPFSGHTSWELGDILTQTSSFTGGGLSVGGQVYPLLVVTCAECGYTVFINAIKAGIVTKGGESNGKS